MKTRKILIVDDEPFNIEYLEQELESDQHEIMTAANGQEGLSKAISDTPDLILLDIMMPVMDGFEVLKHLRENDATRDIPVIIISADNDLRSVVKGIELSAEDYLPKPFEPALLHARISSSLEKKRLRDIEKLYLKNMERELEIGREIQSGFLPTQLPEVEGWELASFFKSAREVAGDFYDAFLLSDGTMVLLVGDVCGKGVGSALFMSLFRSLIRVTATNEFHFPNVSIPHLTAQERLLHVLSFTNNYVSENHRDHNLFATLFIGFLEPASGQMVYANCGNEPAMLIDPNGSIRELKTSGPVIGAFENAEFSCEEILMKPGQMLLAFTDGITDAMNGDQNPFGRERIFKILEKTDQSPNALIHSICSEVKQFSRGMDQFDDMTLLAIRRDIES